MKQLSYWPAEDYINIWVTNMGSNFLGYAQFPVSPLAGLDLGSENALTDGIVVDYMVFGSEAIYPDANLITAYNLGRTTSHEVGHYLGLRHIWGDGDCTEDDFVDDTPTASTDNGGLGIPCAYPGPNSCNSGAFDLPDMFQNYMDYTNDVCMNLFTQGQKDRMLVVLENSPRRQSLLNSQGGLPPVNLAVDAGIRSIPNASGYLCNNVVIPEVEIRNYGTTPVSEIRIRLLLDNTPVTTETFSVSINPLESEFITFNPLSIGGLGEHEIEYIIETVNGTPDDNADNDVRAFSAVLLPETNGPFLVDFESGVPGDWTLVNPDGQIDWEVRTAFFETATNRALFINNFEYELEGEADLLISPVIDLTDAAGPFITFDLSHARYPGNDDALLVTATNLCGDPIFNSDTVFYKSGRDLATLADAQTSPFFPESADEWRMESIDLAAYAATQVRLSFIAINGYGNNLFIDNIRFEPGAVISLASPGLVTCGPEVPLTFTVQNNLSFGMSSADLVVNIGGTETRYDIFFNPPLPQGASQDITLPSLTLADAAYQLEARIENVNDNGIAPPGKNSLTRWLYVSSDEDVSPLLEDFEPQQDWTLASIDGIVEWEVIQTNFGNSAFLDFTELDKIAPLQWLVSPELDFTNLTTPFLTLDYFYDLQTSLKDQLLAYYSTDCGLTYEFLTSVNLEGSTGIPVSENDWTREIIPLELLAGESEVRIALVADGRQAGAIYLDNIQVFVNEPTIFAEQIIYPNPSRDGKFNITVNLDQRQSARIRIINMQGQVILEKTLENVLNQTYPVDLSTHPQGIYIVELRGETFSLIKRVMNAY